MSFGLFALLGILWGLATPLLASPDEGMHVTKAAAVARGQWLGSPVAGRSRGPAIEVEVPAVFAENNVRRCYFFRPATPAGCGSRLVQSGTEVPAITTAGRYPPMYYLLVGWPSLLAVSTRGIYLMRFASAVLCAGFLALAVATALRWSRSRLLAPAVGVAATPMALWLGAMVNPNGFEACATICLWTAACTLAVDHPRSPPRRLVAVLGASTIAVLLARGASPLWPALAAVTLLPVAWRRLALMSLARRRDVQVWSLATVAAAALALIWIAAAGALSEIPGALPPPAVSNVSLLRRAIGQTPGLVRQAVGVLGYLDTPVPYLTFVLWAGALGALVGLALLFGRRRELCSLGLALLLAAAVPASLTMVSVHHMGFIEQGRYFLPLYAGVPVVAGATIGRRGGVAGRTGRVAVGVWGAFGAGQFGAMLWTLHRFLVGAGGPFWPFSQVAGEWRPPLPPVALEAAALVACVAVVAVQVRVLPDRRAPGAAGAPDPDPGDPHG